jgi:hypothetical protein
MEKTEREADDTCPTEADVNDNAAHCWSTDQRSISIESCAASNKNQHG